MTRFARLPASAADDVLELWHSDQICYTSCQCSRWCSRALTEWSDLLDFLAAAVNFQVGCKKKIRGLCIGTWAFFCSTFRMRRAVVESRPEVGSSRYRREGSTRISYPMLVRFLSPPETPLTNVPPIIVFLHLRREPKDARKHTWIHSREQF